MNSTIEINVSSSATIRREVLTTLYVYKYRQAANDENNIMPYDFNTEGVTFHQPED